MSDNEEYDQATPEQKLAVANYIMMSSPTGEVQPVLVDVAKLVNDPSIMSDTKIKSILKKYNENEFQPVKDGEGNSVVISAYGNIPGADDEYLNPSTGKVFRYDHKKQEFLGETEKKQSLAENIADYRSAIEESMAKYLDRQYKSDKCVVTVYGADDGAITICLSARNIRLQSFWAGGWRNTIKINVGTKGTTELRSTTKINVHYFEDGNVQLHSEISKIAQINVGGAQSTADEVAKAVQTIESDFQTALEEMYVDMHHSTIKAMRRFLPITKQPMNWSQYAHSIVQGK